MKIPDYHNKYPSENLGIGGYSGYNGNGDNIGPSGIGIFMTGSLSFNTADYICSRTDRIIIIGHQVLP